jgi:hypothetical protein
LPAFEEIMLIDLTIIPDVPGMSPGSRVNAFASTRSGACESPATG